MYLFIFVKRTLEFNCILITEIILKEILKMF